MSSSYFSPDVCLILINSAALVIKQGSAYISQRHTIPSDPPCVFNGGGGKGGSRGCDTDSELKFII